jgi:hypothetical protein
MSFTVKLHAKDINSIVQELKRKGKVERTIKKIVARSINEVGRQTNTKAKNIIAAHINVRKRDIQKVMKLEQAPAAATDWIVIRAVLTIQFRLFPIIKIKGGNQTKKGYAAKILKSGSRKLIPSAFKARMPNPKNKENRHLGVFKRKTKKRFPIEEKFTTTPWHTITFPANVRKLELFIVFKLPIVLDAKAKPFLK